MYLLSIRLTESQIPQKCTDLDTKSIPGHIYEVVYPRVSVLTVVMRLYRLHSPQPFPPAEPGWSLTEPLAAGWQAMEPHDGAQPRRLGGNAEQFVFGSRMVPAQSGNASRQLDNASAADQMNRRGTPGGTSP